VADRLAKEAARCGGTENVFTRIPKSTLYQEAREEDRHKWQREIQNKAHTKNISSAD